MARIIENAKVFKPARVLERAVVSGNAVISGNSFVIEYATISGNARIGGGATIRGYALVTGDVEIFDGAKVRGTAAIREQKHVDWEAFEARSGRYVLTLYMQANGSVGFTWGCRHGDDLRAYLAQRHEYALEGLAAEPLAFLASFEQANNIGENKWK